MSPSDLAEKLGYTRPRMTRILDSLESKGYVERIPDAKDRRRVIARCTEEGRCHAQDRQTDGVSSLAATLSKMGEHDARELLKGLETAYSITYNKDRFPPKAPGRFGEKGVLASRNRRPCRLAF